jgi:uncharacterized protein
MDARDDRVQLFERLSDPETIAGFFDRVADDVRWTVEGTHPIAGTYTSKAEFQRATFARLGAVMRDRVNLSLASLHLAGDTAIAELVAGSTTLEGARYDNRLCWICRFDSEAPDARIVEVHAYLDSAMVTWALTRNEPSAN